jgi:hypothetical protein
LQNEREKKNVLISENSEKSGKILKIIWGFHMRTKQALFTKWVWEKKQFGFRKSERIQKNSENYWLSINAFTKSALCKMIVGKNYFNFKKSKTLQKNS